MSNIDDHLIKQFKQGDVKAYEQIFRTYYPALCLFALKFLKDKEEAEEVVQDLFCKLWEKRKELAITTSLKSYLYGAIRINSIRKLQSESLHHSHHEEILRLSSSKEFVDDLERNELQSRIHQCIANLPEQRRKVFELSRFQDKKYKEIAEEMAISVKTVENHMGKALKFLREHLSDLLGVLVVFGLMSTRWVGDLVNLGILYLVEKL